MYRTRLLPLLTLTLVAGLLVLSGEAQAGLRHIGYSYAPPQVHYCNSPRVGCGPTVVHVLQAQHPCTGCVIPVEVCLPACCQGVPEVFCRKTLFGSGLSRYTWCSGHSVTLRYQKCGDVKVIYR